MSYVIKFDDGTYNRNGNETTLVDATRYLTKRDAEIAAADLLGVEAIEQVKMNEHISLSDVRTIIEERIRFNPESESDLRIVLESIEMSVKS